MYDIISKTPNMAISHTTSYVKRVILRGLYIIEGAATGLKQTTLKKSTKKKENKAQYKIISIF